MLHNKEDEAAEVPTAGRCRHGDARGDGVEPSSGRVVCGEDRNCCSTREVGVASIAACPSLASTAMVDVCDVSKVIRKLPTQRMLFKRPFHLDKTKPKGQVATLLKQLSVNPVDKNTNVLSPLGPYVDAATPLRQLGTLVTKNQAKPLG